MDSLPALVSVYVCVQNASLLSIYFAYEIEVVQNQADEVAVSEDLCFKKKRNDM